MVKEFNEGEVPVFLISLKAGGVGLNLTGADVVIQSVHKTLPALTQTALCMFRGMLVDERTAASISLHISEQQPFLCADGRD